MKQRTITAIFFVALVILGVYGGRIPFLMFSTLIAAGCAWELMALLLPEAAGKPARRVLGLAVGLMPLMCMPLLQAYGLWSWSFLLLLVPVLLLVELFGRSASPFSNVGHYLLAFFYTGVPIALLQVLSGAEQVPGDVVYHPHRVFGLLWLVWTNDTAAYLIGSRIGRNKLFERISPKKTWEGTIAGIICTMGMAWLISRYFDDFNPTQWIAIGMVVGVFGTLGDLVESMLKRSVGVKDSGTLLPGHGGLLDRFDAFIFVIPFAWLVIAIFH